MTLSSWSYKQTCMDKLQRDGVLQPTHDESLEKCKSCIFGKMARKSFPHQVERAKDLLGLIHTDVCGPFRTVSREDASYFITFTDNFSPYGYVYLMKYKHEVAETFKVFQNEVENQLDKKIKAIRSDREGEYLRYPKEAMGYYFYYPLENKIFVARNAKFFENYLMVQEARHNRVIYIRIGVLAESSQPSESLIGVKCNTCGSTIHFTTDHNEFDHFKRGEKIQATKAKEPTKNGCSRSITGVKSYMHKYVEQLGPKVVFGDNSSCITEGYGSRNLSSMFINHEKYTLVIVDEYSRMLENQNDVKVKQIRTDNRTEFRNYELESFCDEKEISHNFSSPYTPEQNGVAKRKNRTLIEAARIMLNGSVLSQHFWTKAIKIASNSDISYYVIPHGRSLTELTQEKYVPEVIALNEHEPPHTEDTKGPPDLINTEGTHEQNVQDEQIISQPTESPLWDNTEASLHITELLIPDITQSQISNSISTSSHPVPQDRWSKDQHIKLENIIGDPGEGMCTKSMAAKLTAASAIFQMGVKSAFLNGKLKEEVYVKQPPGFESSKFPGYVCKLDKALYGLKQAPKAWYETLSTFLVQNKFVRGRIDNILFIYKSKGYVLLVQVYVDYIIFGSTSYKLYKQFEKLMTKKFEMSMIGELTYFLGLQIKQDDKGISICQEQYTMNILKKYEISYYSSVKTPMVSPNNFGPDLAGKLVSETSYRGMIGSLMYLTATRPYIQFSIVLCARHQSNPKESYLIVVKRIIRYLKGTPNLGLYYPKCSGFDLKRYSDSDYAGCNMDRYSTSGACRILGRKLVS
ncbi:retrovirus-related pol polyprotein from transposon TNT 1-94 [Tanacetum coccineum]|uniref:Retrovirus-related pol polyprotein from transposon TNT 1-94 n=1 Tax=Tanacetum coccineum TaxID=301880 RepID=A0ABQ5BY83_9ASTR